MTAPNHALTGALIGLTVANPAIALPLAFLSHFAMDLVPHFDFPGDGLERISSKAFLWVQIIGGAILCFGVVLLLAVFQPRHWVPAAFCAFLAASPDLFSIPKYVAAKKHRKLVSSPNRLVRMHQTTLQWKTGPRFAAVEAAWFIIFVILLVSHL